MDNVRKPGVGHEAVAPARRRKRHQPLTSSLIFSSSFQPRVAGDAFTTTSNAVPALLALLPFPSLLPTP